MLLVGLFCVFATPASGFDFSSIHAERNNRSQALHAEPEETSGRRLFLGQFLATTTATMASPLVAHADPSALSKLQGPLQDSIAPGNWIGQFLGLNARTVTWTFDNATPAQVSQALVDTFNDLSPERRSKLYMPNFDITQADADRVHVMTWTKNEWLDSLDVRLQPRGTTGTVARANFYATGFLPTIIPGAPILNIGLFWIPFGSNGPREMLQDFRLRAIEGLLRKQLQSS